jgi:hypothetical protein
MYEGGRIEFEKLYPRSVYDQAARHRVIVSGQLRGAIFWGLERPTQGVFFLGENGKRMIYGPGKFTVLSRGFIVAYMLIEWQTLKLTRTK